MNSTRLKIGGVLAVVLVASVVGVWFQFFRDTAPPRASLEAAVAALAPTAVPTDEAATTTPAVAAPTEEAASASDDSVAGEWSVVAHDDAFVGYRIGEELARVGTAEAVGRTADASGSLTIVGSNLTAASITVDMTTLKSDESRRDRALGDQSLQTRSFPEASFELTAPVTLPAGLVAGESVTVTAIGNLTLHGVENTVEIPLDVQLSGDTLVVVGSLDIVLADFDIEKPRSPAVLSVEDHGTLELQLFFHNTG